MPHAASLLSVLVASLLADGTPDERSSAAMSGPHYERPPETRAWLRHGGGENGGSRESRELVSLLPHFLALTETLAAGYLWAAARSVLRHPDQLRRP